MNLGACCEFRVESGEMRDDLARIIPHLAIISFSGIAGWQVAGIVGGMSHSLTFGDRTDKKAVEKALTFAPKFDRDGLIPAMAIDWKTRQPLMLAYMNEESLKLTLEKGEAVYWSRSRQEIWHKGATSGHVQVVKEILVDCDQDALVLVVDQIGAGACHTGHHSCFYRAVAFGKEVENLDDGVVVPLKQSDEGLSFDPDSVYKH